MEIFKKGRKQLLVCMPAITTKQDLKEAVQNFQTGLLKYARTFTNPPLSATSGLGALQREELETRRRTSKQISELQRRLAPFATASTSNQVPMELDAILRAREEDEENYSEDSTDEVEENEALFFMEPNHDEIWTYEDPKSQEY